LACAQADASQMSASGPLAAVEAATQTLLLDTDGPMAKYNEGTQKWCCMLCKRQFATEKMLGQHLQGSQLHATNLTEVQARDGIRGPAAAVAAPPPAVAAAVAPKRPLQEGEAPPARKPRWGDRPAGVANAEVEREPEPPAASGKSGGLSALEQMELFEKRLKVQERRKPEKEKPVEEEAEIDSARARSINNQLDWECSECGKFNFARTLVCHFCRHHVDANTKYLTNRLKEIKYERFAQVFGSDAPSVGRPPVADPAAEHAHARAKLTSDNNIGHQMLGSMGWSEGRGLGRSESGTTEPVRTGQSTFRR